MTPPGPSLFGALPSAVRPADVPERLRTLGDQLPTDLYMGTSSWSFPGWEGLVYQGASSTRQLARAGLEPYAAHPLFDTVGIDRGWYGRIPTEDYRSYAAVVGDGFRFLAKARADCTRPGPDNPRYLDPAFATEEVVGPFVEGLQAHAGPLLFQFSHGAPGTFGGPERFAAQLHAFLTALPRGPLYAVELRSRHLFSRDYADALKDAGASHCINVFPGMPSVETQARVAQAAGGPVSVVRWMLNPSYTYQHAKKTFSPFFQLQAPLDAARDHIVAFARQSLGEGRPTWIIANNKAEGSAPRTIARLAEAWAQFA